MAAPDFRLRHHAALEKIVLFEYRLTCRTGLHIGTGKSADLAGSDLPVMRDAAGHPIIPGSSLRGVLRAGIESFCESLSLNQAVPAPPDGPKLPKGLIDGWNNTKLTGRLFGVAAREPGGFSFGSRLQISDARCSSEVSIELRDGVGICRDTRTATPNAKYDLEVVPAGTRFDGRIRFKNPADHELGLLAQAFWMLDSGLLLLGGKSARGLGWVQVEVTAPWGMDAQAILERRPRPAEEAVLGPVEQRLAGPLAALQELAAATTATSSSSEK